MVTLPLYQKQTNVHIDRLKGEKNLKNIRNLVLKTLICQWQQETGLPLIQSNRIVQPLSMMQSYKNTNSKKKLSTYSRSDQNTIHLQWFLPSYPLSLNVADSRPSIHLLESNANWYVPFQTQRSLGNTILVSLSPLQTYKNNVTGKILSKSA